MLDVIAIGEPLFELNQARDGAPFAPGYGGDTSNAVIAAARSGAATGYFTAVGADRFGHALVELWKAEGVDASRVIVNGGAHTGIYFVTHGPDGHEFSYLRAGSAASRLTEADIPADYIGAARLLHVSGISQAISSSAADAIFAAIDIARRAKTLVSYDTNLRLKLWPLARARAVTHEAMKSIDIALPGLDDARQLTGLDQPDAIVDFYLKLGARIVALTLGREGALVATPQRRERVGSIRVEAVDATGAGDAFDGAFLAEYLRTGDPFASARFANVAAALSTRGYGAVPPLPTRAQTLAALAGEPSGSARS
jgi:2-dehydro-3-deoxygluconokinase